MSDIKISYELRPCIVEDMDKNALFHCFTNEGNAVVEFEDGTCTTVAPWVVRFFDNKFNDYSFADDKKRNK